MIRGSNESRWFDECGDDLGELAHRRLSAVDIVAGRDEQGQIGDRTVTRGRWIHGAELARWYAAKGEFWSLFKASLKDRTMGVSREPGQEG